MNEAAAFAERFDSLVELLRRRAERHAEAPAYTFLRNQRIVDSLTFGELDRAALGIAAHLQSRCERGDRALLLYPPGLDFIRAFFGCLYAGLVAVPSSFPRPNQRAPQAAAIAEDCRPSVVLTAGESRRELLPTLRRLPWIETDAIPPADSCLLRPDALALLQYTSGSTGFPKGVMVTHENLLRNEEMIREAFGHDEETRVAGWLPLYHDMGLIGIVLQPLYLGRPCTLLSPVEFLQRPFHWLKAISDYGATTSGAPCSAYDLCTRRVTEEQKAQIDLSRWKLAFVGAEPISRAVLDRFADAFAPCGFRREAFYPCYGLAEATLFVSGPDRRGFVSARRRIDLGIPWGAERMAVVDPETRATMPEGGIGEVWVSGPNVAGGYWSRPEETRRTFRAFTSDSGEGPFLRTGDLGYLEGGRFFLTGRLKDLIIIRGVNYHSEDIEATVGDSHPSLSVYGCAAFSVEGEEERLVLVQELDRRRAAGADLDSIAPAMSEAVTAQHGLRVEEIAFVKTGALPRTTSGKVRRAAAREQYLRGEMPVLHRCPEPWKIPVGGPA